MKTKFSNLIRSTPARSLLVGTLVTNDREGHMHRSAILEGTRDGFRMLAEFLVSMADSVESGDASGRGRHLSLSPEDIPALCTNDVESLSLGCTPADQFTIPDSTF